VIDMGNNAEITNPTLFHEPSITNLGRVGERSVRRWRSAVFVPARPQPPLRNEIQAVEQTKKKGPQPHASIVNARNREPKGSRKLNCRTAPGQNVRKGSDGTSAGAEFSSNLNTMTHKPEATRVYGRHRQEHNANQQSNQYNQKRQSCP